jgi:hypothetical protein
MKTNAKDLRSDPRLDGRLEADHTGVELSLLVTDVELGRGATGLELTAFVLERFPALKVVIISGKNARPLPAGSLFLRKPYKREELLALATH